MEELDQGLEEQAQRVLEKAKVRWASLNFEHQSMPEQQLYPQQP